MSPSKFEELLLLVGPKISKENTVMRDLAGPSERLSIMLRYLVTGDAQCRIAAIYRISPSTIGRIITETCSASWVCLLAKKFLDPPSSSSIVLKIKYVHSRMYVNLNTKKLFHLFCNISKCHTFKIFLQNYL